MTRSFFDVEGTPLRLTDATAGEPVWIAVASVGAYAGHPSGPFQMTAATFSEIVRNFESRGLPVPVDYEHASELDAREGTIPLNGAPACGWIHKLSVGRDGRLYALVEWLDKARRQIKAGEYKYVSPAIRFGSRDPKTGAQVGAKLTSVALTNQPFLTDLPAVAAKDGAHTTTAPASGGVNYAACSHAALTAKLMTEEKLSLFAAQDRASGLIGDAARALPFIRRPLGGE